MNINVKKVRKDPDRCFCFQYQGLYVLIRCFWRHKMKKIKKTIIIGYEDRRPIIECKKHNNIQVSFK